MYTQDQLKADITLDVRSSSFGAVCDLKKRLLSITVIYSVRFLSFMRYCPKTLGTNVIYNSAKRSYLLINGPSRWVVSKKKAPALSLSR